MHSTFFSFYNLQKHGLLDEFFVSGFEKETKNCVARIGGPAKACLLLNIKYSRLKEWISGRRPIPLSFLIKLSKIGRRVRQIGTVFDSREILLGCRYSNQKIRLPKKTTESLAYIIGVILGDGCLAGRKTNKKQDWKIIVCFDNENHCNLFCDYFYKIFGILPKKHDYGRGYIEADINSKVIYWFLIEFFEIKHGIKHDSIKVPSILKWQKRTVIAYFIRGLFDSDGTVVPSNKKVAFASTSKTIIGELKQILSDFGIYCSYSCWVKKGGFKPLYSLQICSKKSISAFKNSIGFSHPSKEKKLKRLCNTF